MQSKNVQRNPASSVSNIKNHFGLALSCFLRAMEERLCNRAEMSCQDAFRRTCCLIYLLLCPQLFSSEEKHASQQHMVTVHGAPGPEPFTVFSVTEQTTAKQLLDIVSTSDVKITAHLRPKRMCLIC